MGDAGDVDEAVDAVAQSCQLNDVAGFDLGYSPHGEFAAHFGEAGAEEAAVCPGLQLFIRDGTAVYLVIRSQTNDIGEVACGDISRGVHAGVGPFHFYYFLFCIAPGAGGYSGVLLAGVHAALKADDVAAVLKGAHGAGAHVGDFDRKVAIIGEDDHAVGIGPVHEEVPVAHVVLDHAFVCHAGALYIGGDIVVAQDGFHDVAIGGILVKVAAVAAHSHFDADVAEVENQF